MSENKKRSQKSRVIRIPEQLYQILLNASNMDTVMDKHGDVQKVEAKLFESTEKPSAVVNTALIVLLAQGLGLTFEQTSALVQETPNVGLSQYRMVRERLLPDMGNVIAANDIKSDIVKQTELMKDIKQALSLVTKDQNDEAAWSEIKTSSLLRGVSFLISVLAQDSLDSLDMFNTESVVKAERTLDNVGQIVAKNVAPRVRAQPQQQAKTEDSENPF